jgi:hypothetical protein
LPPLAVKCGATLSSYSKESTGGFPLYSAAWYPTRSTVRCHY